MAARKANGDGSVYERGDGRWVASIRLVTGKRISRYCKTRAEANAVLQDLRRQHIQGRLSAPSKLTLKDWVETWMAGLTVRPATVRIYTRTLGPLVAEVGAVRLDKLTPLLLSTTFAKLARDGMGARQLQLGHGYLKGCLTQAVNLEMLAANPMLKVKRPKWEPRQRRYWTVEQTSAFLATCREGRNHWAPLYIVLATCGLRISEALGLTWADIDTKGRVLRVERSLVWVGAEYQIGPVKTTAGYRTVSIPELGIKALESLAGEDERLQDRPVFRSIHGNPPRYDQLHQPLARLCKAASVPRINVHGLRHVAAALSYKATGDALAVQRRLGHTKVTTTLGIYAYLMTSDANTAAAVDGLLGGTD